MSSIANRTPCLAGWGGGHVAGGHPGEPQTLPPHPGGDARTRSPWEEQERLFPGNPVTQERWDLRRKEGAGRGLPQLATWGGVLQRARGKETLQVSGTSSNLNNTILKRVDNRPTFESQPSPLYVPCPGGPVGSGDEGGRGINRPLPDAPSCEEPAPSLWSPRPQHPVCNSPRVWRLTSEWKGCGRWRWVSPCSRLQLVSFTATAPAVPTLKNLSGHGLRLPESQRLGLSKLVLTNMVPFLLPWAAALMEGGLDQVWTGLEVTLLGHVT